MYEKTTRMYEKSTYIWRRLSVNANCFIFTSGCLSLFTFSYTFMAQKFYFTILQWAQETLFMHCANMSYMYHCLLLSTEVSNIKKVYARSLPVKICLQVTMNLFSVMSYLLVCKLLQYCTYIWSWKPYMYMHVIMMWGSTNFALDYLHDICWHILRNSKKLQSQSSNLQKVKVTRSVAI